MKYPHFPLYVNDWLGSATILLMDPSEEGAYIRLLCHAWNSPDCSLPDDDHQLAILSRLGKKWKNSAEKIRKNFQKEDGKLFNPRLLDERNKLEEWSRKSAIGGKRSAEARRQHRNGGSTVVEKWLQPKGNISLSLSSSLSENNSEVDLTAQSQVKEEPKKISEKEKKSLAPRNFLRPELPEVLAYFVELKATQWGEAKIASQAERFVNHYTANGWKVGKNSMKDWKAAIRNWVKNDFDTQQNNSNGTHQQAPRGNVIDRKIDFGKF